MCKLERKILGDIFCDKSTGFRILHTHTHKTFCFSHKCCLLTKCIMYLRLKCCHTIKKVVFERVKKNPTIFHLLLLNCIHF